ncbi:hypothetical protein ACOJBO_23055 [Rhizobium beringeri]
MRVTDTLASERYGKDVTRRGDVSRIMASKSPKVLKPVAKPLQLDLSHKAACHPRRRRQRHGQRRQRSASLRRSSRRGGLKVMLAAGDTPVRRRSSS